MFTKEQIGVVNDFESYIYDNDIAYLDRRMSRLYPESATEGWEGVAQTHPSAFAAALALALDYRYLFDTKGDD